MTFPRIFVIVSLLIFGSIAIASYRKKAETPQTESIEIDVATLEAKVATHKEEPPPPPPKRELPEVNQIHLLFQKESPLPIVETIQYKSRVPWKTGKAAWLIDYATHYKTHIHFIARCLNQKPNYTPPPVKDGVSFNVLSQTRGFYFYLLVDISRCKLWFYAVLPEEQERILLKTYQVCLGRKDPQKASGSLTPIGKYLLGTRTAMYQPKMMGMHKSKKIEMIRVFGTRWIPFDKEIGTCSEPAKGFGIHGTPWESDGEKGVLVDNPSSIGTYDSDGCIRLKTSDIEELFAIISTHRTLVEIIPEYF